MAVTNGGRTALSEWEMVERFALKEKDGGRAKMGNGGTASTFTAALLRVRNHTGRTHQIRVHLSHVGHPIVGDPTYGWRANQWPFQEQPPRVMLHAWRLEFTHPITGEAMAMEAPIPADMTGVMDGLKGGDWRLNAKD
jgi:23S rRNA pseudouridine1911/1915/1917 synthase